MAPTSPNHPWSTDVSIDLIIYLCTLSSVKLEAGFRQIKAEHYVCHERFPRPNQINQTPYHSTWLFDCIKTDRIIDNDLLSSSQNLSRWTIGNLIPLFFFSSAKNKRVLIFLLPITRGAALFPHRSTCCTPTPQTTTEAFVQAAFIYWFQPIIRHLPHFHKMTKLIWFKTAPYRHLNIYSAQRLFSPHTQWLAASVKCVISRIRLNNQLLH